MPDVSFDGSVLAVTKETTRDEILTKFLKDEAFLDITLEGNDGTHVPANRFALAARSDVFQKMLLGDFAEASKKIIPIGFEGKVLNAIVEYMLTDTTGMLMDIATKGPDKVCQDDIETIQSLVSLIGGAAYFNLPLLCEKAFNTLFQSLGNLPSLAFSVLETYTAAGPLAPKIKTMALKRLRTSGAELVKLSIVRTLSSGALQAIVQEDDDRMEEGDLFELVWFWSSADVEPTASSDRHRVASEIMQHIRLERIDAQVLVSSVTESGFFSQAQLLGAYKTQALELQSIRAAKRARLTPHWRGSGTEVATTIDILDNCPMTSGIHRWVLRVEGAFHKSRIWLGVVRRSKVDLSRCLSKQKCTWGINGHGKLRIDGIVCERYHALAFVEGSKITFTLNVQPDGSGGGTLSISVDGRVSVAIDRYIPVENDLVPAVSFATQGVGSVHLLEKAILLTDPSK